jgi:hypothetical protein
MPPKKKVNIGPYVLKSFQMMQLIYSNLYIIIY